jgi:hypothetical protein
MGLIYTQKIGGSILVQDTDYFYDYSQFLQGV